MRGDVASVASCTSCPAIAAGVCAWGVATTPRAVTAIIAGRATIGTSPNPSLTAGRVKVGIGAHRGPHRVEALLEGCFFFFF